MRSFARSLACLVSASSLALLPTLGCSSSSTTTVTPEDAGDGGHGGGKEAGADHSSPALDAGEHHDSGKKKPDSGKEGKKDSGHEKDATNPDAKHGEDARADAKASDGGPGSGSGSGDGSVGGGSDGGESSTSSSSVSSPSGDGGHTAGTSSSSSSSSAQDASSSSTSTTSGSTSSMSSTASSSETTSETTGTTTSTSSSDSSASSGSSGSTTAGTQNYFMGRWDPRLVGVGDEASGIGSVAEWPGSGVITTFTGQDITVTLTDTCNASSGACDTVTIEIDGTPVTVAFVNALQTAASATEPFTLASGGFPTEIVISKVDGVAITAGVSHTIGVYKNTDSVYGGSYSFGGFLTAGNGTNPNETYTFSHRIEWIGDDITAGTGAIASGTCTSGATNSSEFEGYSRLVSEYFNAERHNISLSGVCVSDDCGSTQISSYYAQVTPDDSDEWDSASFDPDLVVVNLGSYGDFASQVTDPGATYPDYQTALQGFLGTVRAAHAGAYILVVSGPGWLGPEANGTEPEEWVTNAVNAYMVASGDTAVSTVETNPNQSTGFECTEADPGQALQSTLAGTVETAITTGLGVGWAHTTWTQGQ